MIHQTTLLGFEDRLRSILTSWQGTKYVEGQRARGRAVDCVRWVTAVLDELYGRPGVPIERLPADRALHDKNGAEAAMRRLLRLYEPWRALEPGEAVEAGDILVVGPLGGGPGHAMIVGPDPPFLWHVDRAVGVTRTGSSLPDHESFGTYRVLDKHLWVRTGSHRG